MDKNIKKESFSQLYARPVVIPEINGINTFIMLFLLDFMV